MCEIPYYTLFTYIMWKLRMYNTVLPKFSLPSTLSFVDVFTLKAVQVISVWSSGVTFLIINFLVVPSAVIAYLSERFSSLLFLNKKQIIINCVYRLKELMYIFTTCEKDNEKIILEKLIEIISVCNEYLLEPFNFNIWSREFNNEYSISIYWNQCCIWQLSKKLYSRLYNKY